MDELAFYVGIAALAALEIIEWPVGLVVGAGHFLIKHSRSRAIHELGEALEEAA